MIGRALAAVAALAAAPAFAGEETRLFESGAWYVAHVALDDGTSACSMNSGRQTDSGETLDSVTFWAINGTLVFHAISSAWDAQKRDVEIRIDVDGHPFNGTAEVDGPHVIVGDLTPEFIAAVTGGSALSLYTGTGVQLLSYTLDGSAAAFGSLLDCWSKLPATSADPFGSASAADPF